MPLPNCFSGTQPLRQGSLIKDLRVINFHDLAVSISSNKRYLQICQRFRPFIPQRIGDFVDLLTEHVRRKLLSYPFVKYDDTGSATLCSS